MTKTDIFYIFQRKKKERLEDAPGPLGEETEFIVVVARQMFHALVGSCPWMKMLVIDETCPPSKVSEISAWTKFEDDNFPAKKKPLRTPPACLTCGREKVHKHLIVQTFHL